MKTMENENKKPRSCIEWGIENLGKQLEILANCPMTQTDRDDLLIKLTKFTGQLTRDFSAAQRTQ